MTLPDTESPPPAQQPRRLGPLGRALDPHIKRLQAEYLHTPPSPAARADLAQLRRGLGKPAGSVPELWPLTLGLVPESLSGDRDEPNRAEQATHAALTLYALHQQSASQPMHQPGISCGYAMGTLRGAEQWSDEAVTRRFMSVATAESIEGILTHVRGLVTQLRTVQQGLDYARLADDFVGLLTPGKAQKIRMQWGRAFYRNTPEAAGTTSDNDSDHAETEPNTSEE